MNTQPGEYPHVVFIDKVTYLVDFMEKRDEAFILNNQPHMAHMAWPSPTSIMADIRTQIVNVFRNQI